ncbi:thioesterase domain-containing protein, partial [Escherichia coli]
LAQGIAARLRARGEQVAFLGLLDTWPPETQNWQHNPHQSKMLINLLRE